MKNLIIGIILLIRCLVSESAVVPSIPDHLLVCYRSETVDLLAPRRLDVFLSLLRKLELNSQLDARMLSTGLLRSLRLDGVIQSASNAMETEYLLPYRASSFQFHRYKLLMDIFLPSQSILNVDETLNSEEKCHLHRMLSSTVRQWERGDENVICPLSAQHSQNIMTSRDNRISSRCPVEDGVIQTEWGTIAPGTLISAIASALEPQRVAVADILNANVYKEGVSEPLMTSALQEWYEDIETLVDRSQRLVDVADISNVWVATLAGDLAEVIVNQGPRVGSVAQNMVVGTNHRWNDTLLPRDLYIFPRNSSVVDWHFTDAEILAGIDGLILSNYVAKWVEQRLTLRLSQIIDMYYSNEGVSFDPTVKACNRQSLFNNLFDTSVLTMEASRFAHVLSLRQITVYVPVNEMERITNAAVTAFTSYVPTLLRQNHRDCQVSQSVPVIDLIVATDSSWKGYDVQQFMSWVGGALEINLQRGSIGLLHGNTGDWIAQPSHNITSAFEHIRNFTDEWPNRLNLPRVISSIIRHSLNKTLGEIEDQASGGPSTVVLIISPTDRPSATELERAREQMKSLRRTYIDVYFAYAAQDLTDFQNVNNEYLDYSELFLTIPSTNVQDVITAVDTYLIKSVIPTRLVGPQCPFNGTQFPQVEYEDFVLPDRQMNYRIHPFYMREQTFIQVVFRNDGQGQLLVCMWRGADASHSCQTILERGSHVFNLTTPCPSPDFCPPAHFIATATSTANLCAHNDCRLPNQVGYYIRHSGLRCLPLRGFANTAKPTNTLVLFVLLIFFYLSCNKVL